MTFKKSIIATSVAMAIMAATGSTAATVSSVQAGNGISVNQTTGTVTVSIDESIVATKASVANISTSNGTTKTTNVDGMLSATGTVYGATH